MTTPISNKGGSENFDEILDSCLRAIDSDQMSVEQCATRYPNYPELAGLLRMAVSVRDLPRPQMPAGATLQMQRRLQAQLRERVRASAPRKSGLASFPFRRLLLTVGVIVLILFVGGFGVVTASARALPSDGVLYTVKRTAEQVRLNLARQSERPDVLYDLAESRLNEIHDLAAQGRAIDEQWVNEMYDSVNFAVVSQSDNAKKIQLTTDAENAVQYALSKGKITAALAQLTLQTLQIQLNINVPNLAPTGKPNVVIQPTTTTPPAAPSATPSPTLAPTEAASITFTPSFTASSTETKAASTAMPTATHTYTPSATPTRTVPAPVLGPSYTPTLGRGPAVTVAGGATRTPTPTQTAVESQTAEASVSVTGTTTETGTEPATEQATATVEVTATPTATDT